MAVSVPPEVSWLLDLLAGQDWPQGDEDALRRCSQAWMDAMLAIGGLAGDSDLASLQVHANADAASADDFQSFWDSYVKGDSSLGSQGTLPDLFKQCESLAAALVGQANEVEYTKLVIVITLVLTAIQIAWAIAMAFATMGGSLTEIGLAMFIGRQSVLMAVGRFVQMALMMLVPDLIAQGVMLAQGRGWDWNKTWSAGENALAAGVLATFLGAAASKLPWMSENFAKTVGGKLVQGLTHFAEGGLVNDATTLTTLGAQYAWADAHGDQATMQQIQQQLTTGNLFRQFLQGGVLATAFYLPHLLGPGGTPLTFTGQDGKAYTVFLDDGALSALRDSGQLPAGYRAPVFGENGLKVGDATFNGQGLSFDKPVNGQTGADLGGGFSVAGPDGSRFTFQLADQQQADPNAPRLAGGQPAADAGGQPGADAGGQPAPGGPRFELVSRVMPATDPVAVPSYHGGPPLEFPVGSVVHYDNAVGPDGQAGQPYRVDVPSGNTVGVYQAEYPGGGFRLTGQVVHSGGVLNFLGIDAARYYGPGGTSGEPLATVNVLTGETTVASALGYRLAHGDWWRPGLGTHPASASAQDSPSRAASPQLLIAGGDGAASQQDGSRPEPAAPVGVIVEADIPPGAAPADVLAEPSAVPVAEADQVVAGRPGTPFPVAGSTGNERTVWAVAGQVPATPDFYHGPRPEFYGPGGNEVVLYALYDRQTHAFLKIGISDDPLVVRYRDGLRPEDGRPVDVFVIGKFTESAAGQPRPLALAVERYLVERWGGELNNEPWARSELPAAPDAAWQDLRAQLDRPGTPGGWPATPEADQQFRDQLTDLVRFHITTALQDRIEEINADLAGPLSAQRRADLAQAQAVLAAARAEPPEEFFSVRQAGVHLYEAGNYDHPAQISRLYGDLAFAEPAREQLLGGYYQLTEQAQLLDQISGRFLGADPGGLADAQAGIATINQVADELRAAAQRPDGRPTAADLRDQLNAVEKISDKILAAARKVDRQGVDAIYKPATAGPDAIPALVRSEPYELYLSWLRGQPGMAPIADVVSGLGSERFGDWANAAKCVHAALAYEASRRLGELVMPTELPAEHVVGGRSGRALADLASVWGSEARFAELAADQLGRPAGVLRAVFGGFGPGARGLVAVGYADGTGHVLNVENVNGRVVFPDALDGKLDARYRLVDPTYVAYLRTDDRNPSPEAIAPFIALPDGTTADRILDPRLAIPAPGAALTDPAAARRMGHPGTTLTQPDLTARSVATVLNPPHPGPDLAVISAGSALPPGLERIEPPPGFEHLSGLLYRPGSGWSLVAYDGSDPRMLQAAARVHWDGVSFIVDMHGGTRWLRAGTAELTPPDLLALLHAAGWDGSQRIVLMPCDVGQDGHQSFAADLAHLAGVDVVAPTQGVWQRATDSRVFIAGRRWDELTGQWLPDLSKPGQWLSFDGAGGVRPVGTDAYGMPVVDQAHAGGDLVAGHQQGGHADLGLSGYGGAHTPDGLVLRLADPGSPHDVPQVMNPPCGVTEAGQVVVTSATAGTRPWVLEVDQHPEESWLGPRTPVDLHATGDTTPNIFAYDDPAPQLDRAAQGGHQDIGPTLHVKAWLGMFPGSMDAVVVNDARACEQPIAELGEALRPGGVLVLDGSGPAPAEPAAGGRSIWEVAGAGEIPRGFELVHAGSGQDAASGDARGAEQAAALLVIRKAVAGPADAGGRPAPDIATLAAAVQQRELQQREPSRLFPAPAELADRYGIMQRTQQLIQYLADKYRLAIDVRPSNPESVPLLEAGGVAKPPAVKMKTINLLDVLVGAPDMLGAAGFFQPRLPPADLIPADLWPAAESRYRQRLEEYHRYLPTIEQLVLERKLRVVEGVVYPFAPFEVRPAAGRYDTLVVGEPTADMGGVRHAGPVFSGYGPDDQMIPPVNTVPSIDPRLGPPVTGDLDIFDIRSIDNTELPYDKPAVPPGYQEPRVWFKKLVDEYFMTQDQVRGISPQAGEMLARQMGVRHGAVRVFVRHENVPPDEMAHIFEPVIASHMPGGTPLIRFQADRPPMLVSALTPVDQLRLPERTGDLSSAHPQQGSPPAGDAGPPPEAPPGLMAVEPPPGFGHLAGMLFQPGDGAGLVVCADPGMLAAATLTPHDDGFFPVNVVGGGGVAWAGNRALPAGELLGLMKAVGWDGAKPVVLLSCDGAVGGLASFTAQLEALAKAEFGDATVIGATSWVWQDRQGNVVLADRTWIPESGQHAPDLTKPGQWVRNREDGSQVVFASGAHGMPVVAEHAMPAAEHGTAHAAPAVPDQASVGAAPWVHWAGQPGRPPPGMVPDVRSLSTVESEIRLQRDLLRQDEALVRTLATTAEPWKMLADSVTYVTRLRDFAAQQRIKAADMLKTLQAQPPGGGGPVTWRQRMSFWRRGEHWAGLADQAQRAAVAVDLIGQLEQDAGQVRLPPAVRRQVDAIITGLPEPAADAVTQVVKIAYHLRDLGPDVTGLWPKPGTHGDYSIVGRDPATENTSTQIKMLQRQIGSAGRSRFMANVTFRRARAGQLATELDGLRQQLAGVRQARARWSAAQQADKARIRDAASRVDAISADVSGFLTGEPPPAWPTAADLAAIGVLSGGSPVAQQLADATQRVAFRAAFIRHEQALADAMRAAAAQHPGDKVDLLTHFLEAWTLTGPNRDPVPPPSTITTHVHLVDPVTKRPQIRDGRVVTVSITDNLPNTDCPASSDNPLAWAGIHAEQVNEDTRALLPWWPGRADTREDYLATRATLAGVPPGMGGKLPVQFSKTTHLDIYWLKDPEATDPGNPYRNHYQMVRMSDVEQEVMTSLTQGLEFGVTFPTGPFQLPGIPGGFPSTSIPIELPPFTEPGAGLLHGWEISLSTQPFWLASVYLPKVPGAYGAEDHFMYEGKGRGTVTAVRTGLPDGRGQRWTYEMPGQKTLDPASPGSRLSVTPAWMGVGFFPGIVKTVTTSDVRALIGLIADLVGAQHGVHAPPRHPISGISPAPSPGFPLFEVGVGVGFQMAHTLTGNFRTEAGEAERPEWDWPLEYAIQFYPYISVPAGSPVALDWWPGFFGKGFEVGDVRDLARDLAAKFPIVGPGLRAQIEDAINGALSQAEAQSLAQEQAAKLVQQWLATPAQPSLPGRASAMRGQLRVEQRLGDAGFHPQAIGRPRSQAADLLIAGTRHAVIRPSGKTAERVAENLAARFSDVSRRAAKANVTLGGLVVDLSGTQATAGDVAEAIASRGGFPSSVIIVPAGTAEPPLATGPATAHSGVAPSWPGAVPPEVIQAVGALRQQGHVVITYSDFTTAGNSVMVIDGTKYVVALPPADATPAVVAEAARTAYHGQSAPDAATGLLVWVQPAMLKEQARFDLTEAFAADLPAFPHNVTLITPDGKLHPFAHSEIESIYKGYQDARDKLIDYHGINYAVVEPDLTCSTRRQMGLDLTRQVLRSYQAAVAENPPGRPPGGVMISLEGAGRRISVADAIAALNMVADSLPEHVIVVGADGSEVSVLSPRRAATPAPGDGP